MHWTPAFLFHPSPLLVTFSESPSSCLESAKPLLRTQGFAFSKRFGRRCVSRAKARGSILLYPAALEHSCFLFLMVPTPREWFIALSGLGGAWESKRPNHNIGKAMVAGRVNTRPSIFPDGKKITAAGHMPDSQMHMILPWKLWNKLFSLSHGSVKQNKKPKSSLRQKPQALRYNPTNRRFSLLSYGQAGDIPSEKFVTHTHHSLSDTAGPGLTPLTSWAFLSFSWTLWSPLCATQRGWGWTERTLSPL